MDRLTGRRHLFLAIAVLVLLTGAAFAPVAGNGFVLFDDSIYLTGNSVVKRGLTAQGLVLAFTRSHAANWHPLTWVSHMVDVELFGLDPRGHHLMSVTLHAAAAVLLLLALRLMTGSLAVAFAAAALFAVHPLRVESVAWAAERKDVLCALFWMATLLAWLRHLRRPSAGGNALAVFLFAAALMAKPMAVTLPVVLLLLDRWPLGRMRGSGSSTGGIPDGRRPFSFLVIEKAPLLALSAVSALITLRAQAADSAIVTLESVPAAARAANAVVSVVTYLGATVFPRDLAVFYPGTARGLLEVPVLAAAAAVLAATFGAVHLRNRRPWLLTGWLWLLVVLLPVLGLIQVGEQARADRYTYLATVGVGLAICWELAALAARRPRLLPAVRAGAVAAIGLLVFMTVRQVLVWRGPESLFRHALAVTVGNWKAAFGLGHALDLAGRPDEAERLYREAIRLRPGFAKAHFNLAQRLMETGREGEALVELRAAVAANPAGSVMRMTLALLLERAGRDEEAIGHLRENIRRSPRTPEAYNNLAALLAARGEILEAEQLLLRALEIDPAYRDARANFEALTGRPAPGRGEPDPAVRGLNVPTTHGGLFGAPAGR
jgi:Flp pilus assembly protein TadD